MSETATTEALREGQGEVGDRSKLSECRQLAQSAGESDKRLDIFREQSTEFWTHFAGPYYGEQDAEVKWRQPLNLMFSLGSTLEPTLAMRMLKSGVATHDPRMRSFTDRMRLGLDRITEKVKVPKTFRSAIRSAFTGMGVVKVGQDAAGELPRCESVSFDDYIIDERARSRKRGAYAYEGHRFRMLYDEVMDGDLLDKAGRKVIEHQAQEQWRNESARAEKLSRSAGSVGADAFQPQIELLELYLPYDDRMVWLPGNLSLATDEYLREFDWYGNEEGPYDVLGFHWVPDNAIPVPLMAIVFDLYLLENTIARKIARQAEAQKDIAVVDAPSPKDEEAIRKAQDGEFVHAPGAKGNVLSFGGASEKGYQAAAWFHDFFSRLSGNTDLIGGMTAQSKTLGQDEMLMGNADVRLSDMRGYVLDMAESVARKFAWYMWEDPKLDMRLTQNLGKAGILPVRWRPGQRMGDFEDYDISISVAGRHSDTPEQKAERMARWFERYVVPVLPIAAQQGSRLNVDLLVNTAGRLEDIDEIKDLWEEAEPIESPAVGPVPGTQRRTERPVAPRLTAGQVPSRPVEAMAVPTGGP